MVNFKANFCSNGQIMNESKEKEILEFLQLKQFSTVEQIAESLYLSTSTVRRKLNVLQEQGLITRTHGGAKVNDSNITLPGFTFRFHQNIKEKRAIANVASSLVKEGDVVFLDGSTSAFYVATFLKSFKNIKIITNGIDTLSELSKTNLKVYSTGGAISQTNNSVLVGYQGESIVSEFNADVVFFSVASIAPNGNLYDCFEEEIPMRKAMLKHSKKKVLLLDNTKFDAPATYSLCHLNDVDVLITDGKIDGFFKEKPNVEIIKV